MIVYLWTNAALYLIFGVMCLARIDSSAARLGYVTLDAAGRSEYAVVYGTLQWGLAIFFAYSALPRNQAMKSGLVLALALYVPIVVCRWITIAAFGVRAPTTLAVGALETVLCVAAIALWVVNFTRA